MSTDQLSKMFSGRGDIQIAYNTAAEDLQNAISGLSKSNIDKLFANGKKFVSVEVIYPKTENVIPYGQALLVFHSTLEYDDNGNVIKEDNNEGVLLAKLIKDTNKAIQKNIFI